MEDGTVADNATVRPVAGSASPATAGTLNPYSCLPCRGRKRKCDRVYPCTNCQKNGNECLFVPRRPSTRQPASVALLERLRHLENLVGRMQQHLDPSVAQSLKISDQPAPAGDVADLGEDFGRLTMENGRSRYITSNSWASLDNEVDDLDSLLQDPPEGVPEQDFVATSHASILGFGATYYGLAQMHPPATQIPKYWDLFKKNCDTLIKVLHKPSVEPLILQRAHTSKGLDALMMAIYHAVVVSLSPEECLSELGGEKAGLLRTFRFATEHALARAGLLETDEMITLQAFTIFLTGLRAHSSPRAMSTLTALLVRLAQNAGIHRDGTRFKLSPFAVELRRRLWWAICVLDSRACEDTGCESTISLASVDTQVPLNVDDEDLLPGMTQLPKASTGFTEMTFSVVRFESTKIFQRVQDETIPGLDAKKNAIKAGQSRIGDLYLNSLDLTNPFSWYVSAISRIVFTKMWLVTYHPYLRKEKSVGLSPDVRNWLFGEATTALELWLRLNTEESTRPWRWLCETYLQWYALTFLLSELCYRTRGEEVTRAWHAIDASLRLGLVIHSGSCQAAKADVQQGVCIGETKCEMYKPLMKLFKTARSARASVLEDICLLSAAASNTSKSIAPVAAPQFPVSNDFYAPVPTTWPLESTDLCPSWLMEDELAGSGYDAAPWGAWAEL